MSWAAAAVALACTIADPAITESSGVAHATGGAWIWTHNDSGGAPELFALDETCGVVERRRLAGVGNDDWEDLAATPDGRLWVGDIGDNREARTAIAVHEVAVGSSTVTTHELRYADGPRDAEALLVLDEVIHVVTKDPLGRAGVYRADGDGVLHRVATVRLSPTGTPGGPRGLGVVAQLAVTGGAVSPDGTRVVLRTYTDAYEWHVRDRDLAETLAAPPDARTPLPETEQGEAVAYLPDGRLVVTSEGEDAPVHVLDSALGPTSGDPRPATSPPAVTSTPAPTAVDVADDADGDARPWLAAAGLAVLAACGVVVAVRRRG